MSSGSRRYLIVSPTRDEAKYCRQAIESILEQTIQPHRWIIADGSSDDTPRIVQGYADRHPHMELQHEKETHPRQLGVAVIRAFDRALATVDLDDYDYICKLDLDLVLPPRYFETLMENMEAEPRIGTCSGKPYFVHPITAKLISEKCGDETSVGMAKFYRLACFRDIGGFVQQVMWDGIDCHRCRMEGWIARSWDVPELRIVHQRMKGSSHRGILTGRFRHGFGQYFMGTGPVFMAASAMYRLTRPPIILGGMAMLAGYVWSAVTRKERYEYPGFREFLRRYHRRCLLVGKKRATEEIEQALLARPSVEASV